MCGICGVVWADPTRVVDAETVRRMTDAIVHRGPDDFGYHFDGAVGLGVRRLAIIDVAGGHQPVANEDGRVHVVYNGEIYNFRGLRDRLERSGHSFSTRTDTEVVVHSYEDLGPDCLHELRGMFALAVWDARERSLLLAIDRFGIKPLYYAVTAEGIVFGSELKCLVRSGLVRTELDLEALAKYFTFGYVPPPSTIFEGVAKLAPGSLLQWTATGGARVRQYWETPPMPRRDTAPPGDLRSDVRAALADAVRAHLVSDVPVGAFLSGGIDSSTVVALMSEEGAAPVRTFSIGFSDPRYNELEKARIVARHFGTEHHELIVEPEAVELMPTLVTHFDEPFADASALPTYHVSKLARESVKVALSGDGGDELFLGYPLYQSLRLARYGRRIPPSLVRALAGAVRLRTPSPGLNDRLQRSAKRISDTLLAPELAYRRKLTVPGLEGVAPLLTSELRQGLSAGDPFVTVDRWLHGYGAVRDTDRLDRFVRTALQLSLPGDMLVKVDRMSMANSLEVRVPLLDHVLAERVAAIPLARRMPRWRLKGLLRDTMRGTLPDAILAQPKRGFNVPLAAWFRGDLSGFAREVLTSRDARARGLIDATAVERALQRHAGGGANLGASIWSLLIFELWCREALHP